MGRLEQKVVLITGAASGIGLAAAELAVHEGATVIVTDLDASAADAACQNCGAADSREMNVADKGQVDAVIADMLDKYGRIDILVNNAGWDIGMPFIETTPDFWRKVIDINYVGALNTCHAVLPSMIDAGGGSIVNLGSDAARVGSSGEAVYAGAKGAIISFSKTLAREVARHNINVNVVCPGPTDTPLFDAFGGEKLKASLAKAIPFRRIGQPTEVASAICFLASEEAAFITGQTLSVSGGLTMA